MDSEDKLPNGQAGERSRGSAATLQNWVKNRYVILWNAFRSKGFTIEQARGVLHQEDIEERKRQNVPMLLSELRKAGLLLVELDPDDSRKRIYSLRADPKLVEPDVAKAPYVTRDDLERLLKKAADLIRTRVDYKFILVLLFLKRTSDKWDVEYEQALKEALDDGFPIEQAKEEAKKPAYHKFILPEGYHWENLRGDVATLPEQFSKAMKLFSDRNPEFRDILDTTDFRDFTTNRENAEILRQLVELFSEKRLQNVSPDLLGDAYEWILRYFAPTKAKEGEVYTPEEVLTLMVEILDPQPGESVYDPACGAARFLIESYRYVERKKGGRKEADRLLLFGQEANQKTLALARMNLFIHEIGNHQLALGDTLLYPKFREADYIKPFDNVMANPPWNQDGYDEDVLKKGEFWKRRYAHGFPPNQSADWAWIQHMLESTVTHKGRVGIVIDSGSLFRGGKEEGIRSPIVKGDKVECVVLLPAKIFYNTPSQAALVILRHEKTIARRRKLLFINATSEFEQHPSVKKLKILSKDNLEKIVSAYSEFKDLPGFARVVDLDMVIGNGCNLTVTRYVDGGAVEEQIDILATWANLERLEEERQAAMAKLESYVSEIGDAK